MVRFTLLLIVVLLFSVPVFAQEIDADILQELLEEYVSEDDPGVVLYVSVAGESWVGALGAANLETGEQVQPDDLFRIGSATKPFVATVMLQLVDEQIVKLEAPISAYLPDDIVAQVPNAERTIVRQMLNMTSGIYNYTETDEFFDLVDENPARWWTPEETVATVADYEPYFAPGEDYYYSNTNYNLAQIIIEAITGQALAEALEERIFEPLGMESCYLETEATFGQNIVRGYADYGEFEDITDTNDGVGLGDGGIVCNAEDLAKFLPALIDGDLLTAESLEEMLETVDDGEGGSYGLGIGYDEGDFGITVGHDGATSGFQSMMGYMPDDDIVIVILTNNFDSEIIEDLTYDTQAVIFGEF